MSITIDILAQKLEILEKQMNVLLSDKNLDISDDKPKKKSKKDAKKVESDDDKPKKKRTSGYILYSNSTRDEVKDALTVDGEKPKNPDIMRELAKNWKALEDDEKIMWNDKAKELKDAEN
jgi:hypothetical protein|tara:strand:- start:112 stop:471 length:360 start_codon:yes stop_codon:yes gene_type:complete